jgi:hypothetical protein
MDSASTHATALTVRDGKFAYVGDDAGATPQIGPNTQVLRVEGTTVLPGLIDSHIHAAGGALKLGGCSLSSPSKPRPLHGGSKAGCAVVAWLTACLRSRVTACARPGAAQSDRAAAEIRW